MIAEVPGKKTRMARGELPLADAKGRDMSQFGAGNPGRELAGRGGRSGFATSSAKASGGSSVQPAKRTKARKGKCE
jgi:hypothetical protein